MALFGVVLICAGIGGTAMTESVFACVLSALAGVVILVMQD